MSSLKVVFSVFVVCIFELVCGRFSWFDSSNGNDDILNDILNDFNLDISFDSETKPIFSDPNYIHNPDNNYYHDQNELFIDESPSSMFDRFSFSIPSFFNFNSPPTTYSYQSSPPSYSSYSSSSKPLYLTIESSVNI